MAAKKKAVAKKAPAKKAPAKKAAKKAVAKKAPAKKVAKKKEQLRLINSEQPRFPGLFFYIRSFSFPLKKPRAILSPI